MSLASRLRTFFRRSQSEAELHRELWFHRLAEYHSMRFILLGRPEPARGQTGVVERYFGRAIAQQTADYMEYEGAGWKHD